MPASDLGFKPTEALPDVFGIVMDMSVSNALVTLVAFVDGTSSLYFGTGGGVIGAGEHEPVRRASVDLLSQAQHDLSRFAPVTEYPLPQTRVVSFYVRTYSNVRWAAAPEAGLIGGPLLAIASALGWRTPHALTPVFIAANKVIAAIRESSAKHEQ